MFKTKINKSGWLGLLCCWTGMVSAQYQVDGGSKTPLLAEDNTPHRIQVWLVYGMENVTLRFTSSSTSHQWYRYRTKALEAEPIASTQQGTTSSVSNLTEGYGYFVKEGDELARYIWLIDYSRSLPEIQNLHVSTRTDPCSVLRLDGTDQTAPLTYRVPAGELFTLRRRYEISYMTQIWVETSKRFESILKIDTLTGDPFGTSITPPPLCDTEIQFTGDLFARHFGVEKAFEIPFYEAVAVEVHVDTLTLSAGSSNLIGSGGEILAPADIRFTAHANTPVASLFVWQIFRSNEPDRPLVRLTEPQVEYTFHQVGEYTVKLEVSDRSGKCTDTEHSYKINITDTELRIPNVFTPEGSPGVNDEFRVAYKSVVRFSAWIFNRWGNELFHWTDPSKGWDGRYRGKLVPAGTYFYLIEYTGTDGKTHKRSGDVTVIRSTKTPVQKQ